jgi:hypothetical protein
MRFLSLFAGMKKVSVYVPAKAVRWLQECAAKLRRESIEQRD